ncbi:nuclear pore complex protein Nup98-Nup96-like [Pomacea canaliculata]|uniref:nuclear pore complex protein Nup98-Nup96-like n=1 Tax=Pomacea canaliculata TaxID=400727 RepID=UPI000D72D79F|nr:nuclear pore complex protein Nup98-Nup96-like [Pomacea canaliculata]XP_025085973.1 nuclear pore complex protein Nup98-Nup96-like [Pomacea canaliculata]XP_025085974.1 nuclear pore complex protein Nup98-Nup96-like [Pomacea canaliculata]
MFGQKLGGFGTGTSTFGTSTPFGGGQSSTGFGTTAFGAQTPAGGGLFGTGTANTTGGLFGQQSTNTFGQQQSSGGFSFGTTSSNSTTGLFGQQSTTGGLFSTPQSTSAFGTKPQGFGGFGTTQTASTGGLFGSTQPPAASASLFSQTGTGLFGGNAAGGTTIKFNPPSGTDTMSKGGVNTNINTHHQCITAMKEYETKSLEELRLEDYAANRKGKQQGTATGFFGQSAPGSQPTSTGFNFGQPAVSAGFSFGTSTATSAGAGLFGTSRPLFGTTNPTTNPTTTAQSGFAFRPPSQTSVFGQQPGGNRPLFGSTTATTQPSLFGNTPSTGFGTSTGFGSTGFGTTTTAGGGLLGSKPLTFGTTTSTASPFGTGTNLFNKPATTSAFSFGTSTSGTGFGTSTGAFGTSGGFGNTTGSLFGNKTSGFGLGNTGLSTGTGFTSGLGTGTTTGLFGNTQAKPAGFNFNTGSTGAFSFGGNPTGNLLGGNASTLGTTTSTTSTPSVDLQQQLLTMASSPYGDSPLFWNLKQNSGKKEEVLKPTNPVAQKSVLNASTYKVSPRPAAKIKPKSLHGLLSGNKSQLFDGLDEEEDLGFGGETFVPRHNIKKLVLKKNLESSASTSRSLSQANDPSSPQLTDHNLSLVSRQMERRQQGQGDDVRHRLLTSNGVLASGGGETPPRNLGSMDDTITALNMRREIPASHRQGDFCEEQEEEQGNISNPNLTNSNLADESLDPLPVERPPHPAGIVLTRPGYYTDPSMDELATMVDENGDCLVEDLTIGREGYGSVFFPGTINVAGMNLDEIVHFRRKEIVVYPNDDNKPPLGEGLNCKAEVTLDCVWPSDKTTRSPIKSPERLNSMNYQEKLEEMTTRMGGKFIDYRPETGSWVFEVPHFTKYGLVEEDEEEPPSEQDRKRLKILQQQHVAVQKQKILLQQHLKAKGIAVTDLDDDAEVGAEVLRDVMMGEPALMSDITQEPFPSDMFTDTLEEGSGQQVPSALRFGVSAQNMQLMKASFFDDDNNADGDSEGHYGEKSTWYKAEGHLLKSGEKAVPSLFSSSLSLKQSLTPRSLSPDLKDLQKDRKSLFQATFGYTSFGRSPPASFHPPLLEHKLLASGMTARDVPHKIVGLRIEHEVPHVQESLMYDKQKLSMDSACFMGRSFRVGWGPGWTLIHSGLPCITQEEELETGTKAAYTLLPTTGTGKGYSRRKAWTICVEKLGVADYFHPSDDIVKESHEELLQTALAHSRIDQENGVPVFMPFPTIDALHQYATHNAAKALQQKHPDAEMQSQMQQVWELCVSLWGSPPELKDDIEHGGYAECLARREAFSRWLSSVTDSKIKAEVAESSYMQPDGHLQAIIAHLSGRQISEACQVAQNAGDDRLALLLAQAAGSSVVRQMVMVQLAKWAEMKVTDFIREQRQRVYCILAGVLFWDGPSPINTCYGLDWKRALALHLWYVCQPNAPISEAMKKYDGAFKRSGERSAYAAPPLPAYLEDSGSLLVSKTSEFMMEDDEEEEVYDTCYHLLKLFCEKGYPLKLILNPTTITANSLDHRLSWHLLGVLTALGFRHLSPCQEASLHVSYAAQLESLGLWHWSLFPLLHIQDTQQREHAIQEILCRHVQLSSKSEYLEEENFILQELQIPPQWIHRAKAIKARYLKQHSDEAHHLLQAGRWNEAHKGHRHSFSS